MGATRKLLSVSTLGLVDFRSDKERTAAYTKNAQREARKQTRLMRQQAKLQAQAPVQAPAPTLPPAGWYADATDAGLVRWWDGARWTERVRPRE